MYSLQGSGQFFLRDRDCDPNALILTIVIARRVGSLSLPLSATFHDNSSVISLESSTSEVYFTFQSTFVIVEASDREMILPVVLDITPPKMVGLLFPMCVLCQN